MTRQEIARISLRAAMQMRRSVNLAIEDPICVYDLAESLGVEVWFVGGASFAGMYAKGIDGVFVPAERPAGRRAFTCAHELAHWRFGHGQRVELLDFERDDRDIPEERLANKFASDLLMPRKAILAAFDARQMSFQSATPDQIYGVACQFGVGYDTIVTHLRWSEALIDDEQMLGLQRFTPKQIRHKILGFSSNGHLQVVDRHWKRVPVDLEVGDLAIFPNGTKLAGAQAKILRTSESEIIIEAVRPGIGQAHIADGASHMVRVSRKQFTGRAAFRHLEEDDDDTTFDN